MTAFQLMQAIAWHLSSAALWLGLAACILVIIMYVEGTRR